MTLYGNRVTADVMKCPSWTRLGPSSSLTDILVRRKETKTERGDAHVKTEAETGVTLPPAKGHQKL